MRRLKQSEISQLIADFQHAARALRYLGRTEPLLRETAKRFDRRVYKLKGELRTSAPARRSVSNTSIRKEIHP